MLNVDQVLAMIESGYTTEQIKTLDSILSEQAIEKEEKQIEETPASVETVVETVREEPVKNDAYAQIMDALSEMNQRIISQNISNSKQPEPESVESIMANIISPNRAKGVE